MAKVVVYSSVVCTFCKMAKKLFDKLNVTYTEILVDQDPRQMEEMIKLTGRRTIPQIIIDGKPIGGFNELAQLEHRGELEKLLKS